MKRYSLIITIALGLLALAVGAFAQVPHPEVVAEVKNELLRQGENLSGACGAFKITAEVGTRLRNEGWGYVHSTGNGCPRNGELYRADTLMQPNGVTIDILRLSESNQGDTSNPLAFNIPTWDPTGLQDPTNWRAPFASSTPVPPIPIPPVPTPGPIVVTPTLDLSEVYRRLDALSARLIDAYNQNERIYADLVARDVALSEQLRRHDEEPSWVRKFFGNSNTITAIVSGLAAALAAHQASQ